MDLSIIIVNYNTKELTRNCIKSVIKNTQHVSYEIILVDNASKDGSCEYLREFFPNLQIIGNSENLGFAKANNQGIRAAKGKFILLLNSDTEFLEDCLPPLLKFLIDTPTAGVVGCKVLNSDETLQGSVYHFPSVWSELIFFTKGIIKNFWDPVTYFYKMRYWDHNQIRQVDCVSGCFFLIRRAVLENVGLLDEDFFMYYEDSEFCFRVRHSTDYRIYYYPFYKIMHYRGKSEERLNIKDLKECYVSAYIYLNKSYGIRRAKLFKLICRLIWKSERLFLKLFFISKKAKEKELMLEKIAAL